MKIVTLLLCSLAIAALLAGCSIVAAEPDESAITGIEFIGDPQEESKTAYEIEPAQANNALPEEIAFVIDSVGEEYITAVLHNNAANGLFVLDWDGVVLLEQQTNALWHRPMMHSNATAISTHEPIQITAGQYQRITAVNEGLRPGTYRFVTNATFSRINDRFITGFVEIWQGTIAAEFVIEP